jgi:hypothetical protein
MNLPPVIAIASTFAPVDNGLFHTRLEVASSVKILSYYSNCPHSPELNPIERVWEHLKHDLKWELFDNLEHLPTLVAELLAQLTREVVASLTGYDFILNALSVANIF